MLIAENLDVVQNMFSCNMAPFPCKYLGLPLSVKKLPKNSFIELIDKIADKLLGWKASLMNPAGRATFFLERAGELRPIIY
jgi:hypothetical protein